MIIVSILTLTKNNASDLVSLAPAVRSLDDSRVEWVIKDSSTTEESLSFLRVINYSWFGAVKLSIITEQDSSLYGAFNQAVSLSSGLFCINFNPDDLLCVENFRYFLKNSDFSSYDVFVSPLSIYYDKQKLSQTKATHKSFNCHLHGARAYFEGCATSLIFSKKSFARVGGFNESFSVVSDIDFMLKLITAQDKISIYYLNANIGYYGMTGVSSRITVALVADLFTIYKTYFGFRTALLLVSKAIIGKLDTKVRFLFR